MIDIFGDSKKMDTPLELSEVLPGSFQGLLVRDRTQVNPSLELEDNVDDPDYGLPMYYDVELDGDGRIRVHHSRVLRFTGRELPQRELVRENWFAKTTGVLQSWSTSGTKYSGTPLFPLTRRNWFSGRTCRR